MSDARDLGMALELDSALIYDASVQKGCPGQDMRQEIKDAFATERLRIAQDRRPIVSRLVSEASKPELQEDVRSRKECVSTGQDGVHGAIFQLANWALLDGVADGQPF